MATKEQLLRAIYKFIDNDMLPKADGNYKIILGIAKTALNHKADSVFNAIKNNSVISMFNIIDENDNVDVESLANILTEGMGSNEFTLSFKLFTSTYVMHFSSADIQTIKNYII